MERRRLAAVARVLLPMGALAACAGGPGSTSQVVCPAIGWTSSLAVEIEGDSSPVGQVQVCDEEGCWPDPHAAPMGGGLIDIKGAGSDWSFTFAFAPDPIKVLVTSSTGTVLSETEVDPEWVRVGGSAECGGPHRAVVTVQV